MNFLVLPDVIEVAFKWKINMPAMLGKKSLEYHSVLVKERKSMLPVTGHRL